MKIAVIGDLHIISSDDSHRQMRERRSFFKDAWPSFCEMIVKLRQEAPDLVIFVGDLVDWYSDDNRDFAIQLINKCRCPWIFTPGNHDFSIPVFNDGKWIKTSCSKGYPIASKKWEEAGTEVGNRYIDGEGTGIFLINSACSDVPEGTKEWLYKFLPKQKKNIIFTHVPFDTQAMRDYILSVDPTKDMNIYVQSYAPGLFDTHIQQQVDHVFSGHLHFTGVIKTASTKHHLVGMGITPLNDKGFVSRCHIIQTGKKIIHKILL